MHTCMYVLRTEIKEPKIMCHKKFFWIFGDAHTQMYDLY